MSRPKNKGGRTLPMSANGESDSRIPPDIVWDENNPPVVFACNQHTEHKPECDGNCDSIVITEAQCILLNESRAWARAGMVFMGVPAAMQHLPFVNGIAIEMFDNECRSHAMKEILIEAGIMTEEEFDERFRKIKFGILHDLRMANERRVKEERTKAMLGLDKPKLLGPHGEPIG